MIVGATQLEQELMALDGRSMPVQRHQQPDGWTFLVFTAYSFPPCYSRSTGELMLKIPPPYPAAALDMFWTNPDLRLADGRIPTNTSIENVLGREWLRFSWHPSTWRPGRDNLTTYLCFVERRLGACN